MKDERIIPARDIILYLALKKQGYVTVWVGEGKICLKKEVTKRESKDV